MKPCHELTWEDYLAEGRRKYRWGRFKSRVALLFKPELRRKLAYTIAHAPPYPGKHMARELSRIRRDCEDERRLDYRDKRIRKRLSPWAGIKLFQHTYIGDRRGRFAVIQRHWPHHFLPVWNVGLKQPFLHRCQPWLEERYFVKMNLHMAALEDLE